MQCDSRAPAATKGAIPSITSVANSIVGSVHSRQNGQTSRFPGFLHDNLENCGVPREKTISSAGIPKAFPRRFPNNSPVIPSTMSHTHKP